MDQKRRQVSFVDLAPHNLQVSSQLLIPLLLGLTAIGTLLVGAGTAQATLAQRGHTAVKANPPLPYPVVVTTIPIPVPSPLIHAVVAVNPTTGYAYVLAYAQPSYPNYPNVNLTIISGTEVIFSSTSADYRGALAVNPNLSRVYAPIDGGVAVISGTEIVEVIPVNTTLTGRAIGVEPNSGYIYVDGYEWFVICIPETPWCGGIVWVLGDEGSTRLNTSGRVETIGINPTNGYAYVTCRSGGLWDLRYTVVVHGTEEIAQAPSFGEAIGTNPDTGYVYISAADQNRVYMLSDTQVVQTLTTGTEPRAIGINPRTGYVYVANAGSNDVTVISKTQVITTLTVGLEPKAIGVNPKSGYIYVTNADDDTLSVISDTQVIWTLPAGHAPGAIGVNSGAGYAYVVNYDDATISVIREMILPHRLYLPLIVKH